jgi:hypothetical protein
VKQSLALTAFIVVLVYELTAVPPHVEAHSWGTLSCVLLLIAGMCVDFFCGFSLFNSSIEWSR